MHERAACAPLQDALKTARQAVGALGDTASAFSGASGDDKASVAARVAALRRLQAAQKGLQGVYSVMSLLLLQTDNLHLWDFVMCFDQGCPGLDLEFALTMSCQYE